MSAVSQHRGAEGELWQPRFFDRALRTVKEYNEKVEYIHLDPVGPVWSAARKIGDGQVTKNTLAWARRHKTSAAV
jgi:hypothetical protein